MSLFDEKERKQFIKLIKEKGGGDWKNIYR